MYFGWYGILRSGVMERGARALREDGKPVTWRLHVPDINASCPEVGHSRNSVQTSKTEGQLVTLYLIRDLIQDRAVFCSMPRASRILLVLARLVKCQ